MAEVKFFKNSRSEAGDRQSKGLPGGCHRHQRVLKELVDVRSFEEFVTIEADIGPGEVVGEDEDDVGFVIGSSSGEGGDGKEGSKD